MEYTQHDIIVFTDGACLNNGKKNAKAGFACVWPDHPEYDIGQPLSKNEQHTNNRAEYHALLHALKHAEEVIDPSCTRKLLVYTDSKLMIDSFTKWIASWKRKGWVKADGAPVANVDLLKSIDQKMSKRRTEFRHIRAHTGKKDWESVENDKVDKLARASVETSCGSGGIMTVFHPPSSPSENIACSTRTFHKTRENAQANVQERHIEKRFKGFITID